MGNITLKVDDDLLREAKILAAKRGTSVSALVAEQIEALVQREAKYDAARRRALKRLAAGYDLRFTPAQSRDELHER
jgi:predicted transcriptional regulator